MKKRFQILLSLVTTIMVFLGFVAFVTVTKERIYQNLIEQAIKDNQVIGDMVVKLLQPQEQANEHLPDSAIVASLQKTCDSISLPNGGFLCVANAQGALVALPGLKPGDVVEINQAKFSSQDRSATKSFSQIRQTLFKGFYEYDDGYSDIVVSMPYNARLQLLVHQNNAKIKEIADMHSNNMLSIGLIVALICGGVVFLIINSLVSRYEHRLESINQGLTIAYQEISEQKQQIEGQGKKIKDSIRYASKIQTAMLPTPAHLSSAFNEIFTIYRPKDIVSGDFYWLFQNEDEAILALLDCTGHGVPGALMSMMGESLLNSIVAERQIREPKLILEALNNSIIELLQQHESQNKDGMEGLVIRYHKGSLTLASAMGDAYLVKNQELTDIKGTRMALGGLSAESEDFSQYEIDLQNPTHLFICSDGFSDQFGGNENKKLGKKQLRQLLLQASNLPFQQRKGFLEEQLLQWQGSQPQTDDITLIGIGF